jgi:hypothetical protein
MLEDRLGDASLPLLVAESHTADSGMLTAGRYSEKLHAKA